jgi:hypothetical protein
MVWHKTKVYRSTFRKLPTGALFNITSSNDGVYVKKNVGETMGTVSGGVLVVGTVADKTVAVTRKFTAPAYS